MSKTSTNRVGQFGEHTFVANAKEDAPPLSALFTGVRVDLANDSQFHGRAATELSWSSFSGSIDEAEEFTEALREAIRLAKAGGKPTPIKALVATSEKQGQDENDFCFCREGELVRVPEGCEADNGNIDGSGLRSFSGCYSHRATTTVTVVERNLTPEEYHGALAASIHNVGWIMTEEETRRDAITMLELAGCFQVGDIIERRGSEYAVRD